jgi:hypothetical protein
VEEDGVGVGGGVGMQVVMCGGLNSIVGGDMLGKECA